MSEAIEGLRHVLVHDYYTVNTATIWAIIENDLPLLQKYLEGLSVSETSLHQK